jgi:type III secretion system YscQ/HrcQ family protein
MAAPHVSDYPYARWPSVSRVEARGLQKLLRSVSFKGLRRAEAAVEALLGTRVRLAPGVPEAVPIAQATAALREPVLALALQWMSGARPFAVLCELPSPLGAVVVDRALGGQGQPAHVTGDCLDELSTGVVAYVAARAAAAAGGEVRVQGVITSTQAVNALLAGMRRALVLPFSVELGGGAAGSVRAICDLDAALALAGEPLTARIPESLCTLPIALCAHAAQVVLRESELRALAPGDVVVPERCALVRDGRGFRGQIALHACGGRHCGFVCSASGSELRIEKLIAPGETAMTQGTQGKRIHTEALESLERGPGIASDAPIELCLELARFTLPLDAIAALRPGEVLCTGKAIGERVTLRAAGQAFAHGELVEVEGEIGVRITELP